MSDPVAALERRLEAGLAAGLEEAGLVLHRKLIVVLSQRGTGRVYRRPGRGTHRASRPGEPPAPDSGTLRRSYRVRVVNRRTVRVGSRLKYAWELERLRRRPHLSTAVQIAIPSMRRAIRENLRAALRGGG